MAQRFATAPKLTMWMTAQEKPLRRAGAALTIDVIDALEALRDPALSATTRDHLTGIVERADQVGIGVPVAAAATMLEVSSQTVHTWIKREVLDVVEGARPTQIRPRSLAEVVDAVSAIRSGGEPARRVLRDLVDLRDAEELSDRLDELADRTAFDPDRIEEQLFS